MNDQQALVRSLEENDAPGDIRGVRVDGAVGLFSLVGKNTPAMEVQTEPDFWTLGPAFRDISSWWLDRHPGERSDEKLAISRLESGATPRVTLRRTSWQEARPLHEWLSSVKTRDPLRATLVEQLSEHGTALVPGIAVSHCVLHTLDDYLLVARRASTVAYHPGRWTCSCEEGLAPEDLAVNPLVFEAAAARGAGEELLGVGCARVEWFRILGFIVESEIANPAAVVLGRIPMTLGNIVSRRAKASDANEFVERSLSGLRADPTSLAGFVSGTASGTDTVFDARWHPTARFRVLMTMLSLFGWTDTVCEMRKQV